MLLVEATFAGFFGHFVQKFPGKKSASGTNVRFTCEDRSRSHSGVAVNSEPATRTGEETCGPEMLEILSGRRSSFSTVISAWLSAF